MPDTILLLRLEHANMSRLLDLVDQQRARLEQNIPLDYDMLRSIVDYFASYPDQCHHPKEELVYRKLKRKMRSAIGEIDLTTQHQRLIRTTQRLGSALEELPDRLDAARRLLRDLLREFVEHNRDHMAMEEQRMFPLALRVLSRDDWEAIEFDLFDRADPLFDRYAETRFRALREKLPGFEYPREDGA